MSSGRRRGLGIYLTNLRQPMPLGAKLRMLLVNNWRRLRYGKDCCDHPGQPGC